MLLRSFIDSLSKQISWKRPYFVSNAQTTGYSTDRSLPPKPKRCKNPWVFYFMENISKAKADNPGTSSPKLFQLLSAKWQSLGEEAQKKYLKLAEADKNRYMEEIQVYRANLTPEKASAIAEEKARAKLQKEQITEKKKLKALGLPKKPPNAYILFSSDFMKRKFSQVEEGGKFAVKNQASAVGEAWSKLSANEKAKWEELAAVKAKEAKKKVEEWESDMAAKGFLEIVDNKKT
ncbi:transcription factor A, mitochondrial-like [Thrips palmi]|uniref:Transcription factor A, mitochondrial-like n=1 Tax=Thrips palmi TaxID=161013 RepID=A0A6P8YWV0_THRPL|nr:transcription factor A, mitochondrial-like [Thrips palmi]